MLLISLSVFVGLVGEVILESQLSNVGTLDPSYNGVFANKCIEDLGCFYTGPPFYDPIYRPTSLPPVDNIRTQFLLYTRSNPEEPTLLNMTKEGVMDSNFDAGLPTKIIIHGSSRLKPGDVQFTIKDKLLKESPYNAIIVNWTDGCQGYNYYQTVANSRVVGAQTGKLINLLIENRGVTPGSFHIIGDSLGGHVSGWAGKRVPGLGRITGLDPCGPLFHHAPSVVRLDATDADFVDVIHTNGGDVYYEGMGIKEPIGYMNFYVNGGNRQPGCYDLPANMTYKMADVNEKYQILNCDHMRASTLFVDSINTCTFYAVECKSYEMFERGECNNGTVSVMGLRAEKIPDLGGSRKFFLNTEDEPPFCQQ